MLDLLKDLISSFSIKWFRGTEEIFSYIASLSESGVSTIAKSVPGIFIQASEQNLSYIATLSDSGVSTIAKSVPGIFIQAS
jgi:hypothetical protein